MRLFYLILIYFISVLFVLIFAAIKSLENDNLEGFIIYLILGFVLFLGICYIIYTRLKINKNKVIDSHA